MSIAVGSTPLCHNCRAPLHGRFCAQCGQEARPLDPSLRDVLGELAREVTDLDGRVPQSVRRLFLSPGFLTREYFEGRRAAWVSPVRLYLIFSVCYFAVAAFVGSSPLDVNLQVTGDGEANRQRAIEALGFSTPEDMQRAVNRALNAWIPRAMFVLVPVFAWLVRIARRKAGHKYPHHLIFALHLFAAFFGVQTIVVAGAWLIPSRVGDAALGICSLAYFVTYMVLALRTVYGGTAGRAVAHTLMILAGYWLATMIVVAGIVVPVVFWRPAN